MDDQSDGNHEVFARYRLFLDLVIPEAGCVVVQDSTGSMPGDIGDLVALQRLLCQMPLVDRLF